MKKEEGNKKYKLAVTDNHEDVNYNITNVVSNIVITTYDVRWVLDY